MLTLFSLTIAIAAQTTPTFDTSRPLWDFAKSPIMGRPREGMGQATTSADGTLTLNVAKGSPQAYDFECATPSFTIPVKKGDVLYFEFEARCTESEANGIGRFDAFCQLNRAPWTGQGSASGSVDSTWRKYNLVAKAIQDYAADNLMVTLHIGGRRQTLEVKNFRGYNLKNTDPKSLPIASVTYAGRAKDAKWRAQADAMIEKNRKGDFNIEVVDAKGKPIPGATVEADLKRHAYAFGSFTDYLASETTPDGLRYRKLMQQLFNRVTLPMYWADWGWENEKTLRQYFSTANWAKEAGFDLKAHVLVYPGWTFLPTRLKAMTNDPEKLRNEIRVHIIEKLEATRQFGISNWDVTNELRDLKDLENIFGQQIYAYMFKLAKEFEPKAKLYINENSLLEGGLAGNPNLAIYEGHIRNLIKNGASVEGIGMQSHFGESLTPPEDVWKILDRFGKFNLPIEVTEYDVDTRDERAQGDYTRDFLTAVFAHPATTGFTMWGFYEGSHWKPNGAMIRKDWSLKPAAEEWIRLTQKVWTTRAKAETNSRGRVAIRGFLGDYQITVRAGSKFVVRKARLARAGNTLRITVQ